MHKNHPDIAARWEKETQKGKKLPKHVKKNPKQTKKVNPILSVAGKNGSSKKKLIKIMKGRK